MTDTEFDTKFDYYETVREELGLSAIWSIYEVKNLSEPHPFKDAKIVSYKVYHGKEYQIEINGSTWAALFVAANELQCDDCRASFPPKTTASNSPASAVRLSVGDCVRRGKDWKWGNQDENGLGTIVETLDSDGWIAVKWDHGSRNKYSNLGYFWVALC